MVTSRDVEYEADGVTMVGRLALPDGDGPAPAVLVCHEANGLDDWQRSRAEQLAELGYVALAMDYHGGGQAFTDPGPMFERIGELGADPDRLRAIATTALDVLLAEPRADADRAAAIGYCFGATVAMELARTGADLKAVVGFHPGLGSARPADSANIRAKVLMCIGQQDTFIDAQLRMAFIDEMTSADVDWQVHLYGDGVRHSFTHPNAGESGLPGLEYHPVAAARAWKAMRDLFDEVF